MSSPTVPTAEQIEALLDFFTTNPYNEIARKSKRGSRSVTAPLWKEMATRLNAMGGCTKNVKQWQRVWEVRKLQTMRSITKLRLYKAGRLKSAPPPLPEWKQRVAAIVGYDVEEDKEKALVRAARIIKKSTVTSTQSQENEERQMENEENEEDGESEDEEYKESEDDDDKSEEDEEESEEDREESAEDGDTNESRQGNTQGGMESLSSQEQQQCNQNVPQTQHKAPKISAPISGRLPQRSQRRRPYDTPSYSIQERLFRIEERREENDIRRNEELAGIRMALVDLCRLVQQLIECHYER